MSPSRKLALLVAAGLLLAQGAWAGQAVISGLPRSRLARQVVVYREGVEQGRISAPGRKEVPLACTHVPGRSEALEIEVTSLEPVPPDDCVKVDPAGVQRMVAQGRGGKVQFVDTLGPDLPDASNLGPISLPDGRTVQAGRVAVTASSILCIFPDGMDTRELRQGARVRLWGTVFRTEGGVAALAVDGVRAESEKGRGDEPPWQVVARWGGREVLSVKKPGDYELRLPCAYQPGAEERAGVRVREFRVADIKVDGHPVAAELAVSPQAMSYGLQGRAGLDPDCGMLFCFAEPTEPTFVMKTVSFPLSIAFIRRDGVITNIVRLNPGDPRHAVSPVPVSYVLEMEQGWFAKHGVGPGRSVDIP